MAFILLLYLIQVCVVVFNLCVHNIYMSKKEFLLNLIPYYWLYVIFKFAYKEFKKLD